MIELPVTLTSTGGAVSFASPVPLGYTKNKGVYRLLVTAEGEWDGLTIRCFWHLPGGTDPASSIVQDGAVDVPASVTAHPGNGCITFEGSDGVKTVTSADLRYRVGSNSGTEDGTMPEPGTPAWEQLVSETAVALEAVQKQIGNLDDLTTKAKETLVAAINEAARTGSGGAGSMDLRVADGYVQYSTDSGVTWTNLIAVAELKGAKGDKGDPGNKGEPGAAGAPGKDGLTPHIGENGNWWIGDTDTGISAKGVKGNTGDKGEKGDTGPQGAAGPQGPAGKDGAPGADGYSPTASVEQSTDGAKITITDKSGTTEAVVKNGKDGANGRDGADGQPGRDGTDGAPGRDGVDGQPGKDGTDGITPTIGDNGNWFLGATDTGKPSRGATGDTGQQGPAGKDGAGMDITGATVGQIAKISAVDENGKPTAWVPVDMSGGGLLEEFELVFEDEITEDLGSYKRDVDQDGKPFALSEAAVVILTKPFTDDTAESARALGLSKDARWGRTVSDITGSLKKGNIAMYDVVYAKVVNGYHMCITRGSSINSTNIFGNIAIQTNRFFPVSFESKIEKPFALKNVKYPVIDAVAIVGYTSKLIAAGTKIRLYKRKGDGQ